MKILLGARKEERDQFIWDIEGIGVSLETLGMLSKKELGEMKKMMLNGGKRTKMMKMKKRGKNLSILSWCFHPLLKVMIQRARYRIVMSILEYMGFILRGGLL